MARHLSKGRAARKSRQESALTRQDVMAITLPGQQLKKLVERGHGHCTEAKTIIEDSIARSEQ